MLFRSRQIRNRYLRKYYEAIGDYRGAYDNLRTDVSETGSSLAADGWEKTKRAAICNSVIKIIAKEENRR